MQRNTRATLASVAAGRVISNHRPTEEAQRKMEATRQNLLHVDSILTDVWADGGSAWRN